MSDKIFLDTNIIIYSYSNTDSDKQKTARQLIENHTTYISTQVLHELTNTFSRKFKLSWADIRLALKEIQQNNLVYINTTETIDLATHIAQKYRYSFYDSLIVAAALKTDCQKLYSEDMHHEHLVNNQLLIVNPFLEK